MFVDNYQSDTLNAEVAEYAWDNKNWLAEVKFFAKYASFIGSTRCSNWWNSWYNGLLTNDPKAGKAAVKRYHFP
jgi:hypothetical protein